MVMRCEAGVCKRDYKEDDFVIARWRDLTGGIRAAKILWRFHMRVFHTAANK
jgi:hypothetical protein